MKELLACGDACKAADEAAVGKEVGKEEGKRKGEEREAGEVAAMTRGGRLGGADGALLVADEGLGKGVEV